MTDPYYYWGPCNDQTLGPAVSVMSNATSNGTYISMYTLASTPATGQKWQVIGYGQVYFIRPCNCLASPTSVLDTDNGIGNYTHLWEYYPNANQLFDFWPITLGGVDYNIIRRVEDGAYLSYIGVNNNDHLYSTSTQQDNNRSIWRWYLPVGRDCKSFKTVSADYIKKNAIRIPDKLSRPVPTPAALERLYAAVRKARLAIEGSSVPKLLTDSKAKALAPTASKPKAGGKKVKKAVSKKTSKAKAVKKPKKAASKKVKKPAAKKASKPNAAKKPKATKPKSKKPSAASAKKAPKKAAGKKAKK